LPAVPRQRLRVLTLSNHGWQSRAARDCQPYNSLRFRRRGLIHQTHNVGHDESCPYATPISPHKAVSCVGALLAAPCSGALYGQSKPCPYILVGRSGILPDKSRFGRSQGVFQRKAAQPPMVCLSPFLPVQ
jgi:hypothetical protein